MNWIEEAFPTKAAAEDWPVSGAKYISKMILGRLGGCAGRLEVRAA